MNYSQHCARQHALETDGGTIAYVDEGQGPVILLLHGFPTSSWLFRNVIPILATIGFRVIAPDMLGYGNSAKPNDPALLSTERQTRRILVLMQALGIHTWTQVCHDLGGPWTWELIDLEPQHLRKLVISNTTAYLDGWHPPAQVRMMSTPIGAILLKLLTSKRLGPRLSQSMFADFVGHPENLTPSVVEGYWMPMHAGATRTVRYFSQSIQTLADHFPRYQAALKRLEIPAMLIWGRSDQALDCEVMTGQFARDLRIPKEQIHIFEDAKHFLWEDYPRECADLIARFAK